MAGKIALITGASRGLGRNMAVRLAAEGLGVVGTFNSGRYDADRVLEEIRSAGGSAEMLQLDVSNSGSFKAFAAEFANVLRASFERETFDFLVNNAGIGMYAPFAQTTEAQFDELTNIHFKAPFFLTQALLPMIADEGRILNLSSGLARFTTPGFAAYAACKGAVDVLTRYMAVELGGRRIRVNVLAPGAIETDFGGGTVRDNSAVNKMVASKTALGRVGLPDDIGAVVAAILSEHFGWVNGTKIDASGGQEI